MSDEQISASSYFKTMPPENGRLHFETDASNRKSCWGPRQELGQEEWIQIDLKSLHTVTAIITQGDGDNWRYHWVETYRVHYASKEGSTNEWLTYKNLDGTAKVNNKSCFVHMQLIKLYFTLSVQKEQLSANPSMQLIS